MPVALRGISNHRFREVRLAMVVRRTCVAAKTANTGQDNLKDPESERLQEIVQSRIKYLEENLNFDE